MFAEQFSSRELTKSAEFDGHEQVHYFADEKSGLRAIIAIHNRSLGPAAGGCRFWPYKDRQEALADVLRLSKAMSFKNAMAGLPLGGGKAVVWSDREDIDRTEFFRAFGRTVAHLDGAYITAEDVGTRVADMKIVAEETSHVCGLPPEGDQVGGDPSPTTAHGVFLGVASAAKFALSRQDLDGVRVSVQGLGGVGYHLCKELHRAGAKLTVADIDPVRLQRVAEEFGCAPVDPSDILTIETDIIAPCALGGVLNSTTIPRLQAKIVAGAANNQLTLDQDGELLRMQGILYAPDYVINAGGIIQVAGEFFGWSQADVDERVASIPTSLQQIFEESGSRHRATNIIADQLARERLRNSATSAAAV